MYDLLYPLISKKRDFFGVLVVCPLLFACLLFVVLFCAFDVGVFDVVVRRDVGFVCLLFVFVFLCFSCVSSPLQNAHRLLKSLNPQRSILLRRCLQPCALGILRVHCKHMATLGRLLRDRAHTLKIVNI